MIKAIITLDAGSKTSGIVEGLAEFTERGLQGFQLPSTQIMWDATQYEVQIGDLFIDGSFYRADVLVDPIPTTEQEIANLKNETYELEDAISTMMGGVQE